MSSEPVHAPAMLEETIAALRLRPGLRIADATLGLGGHAAVILEKISPGGTLIGLDRDPRAIEIARKRLEAVGGDARLVHAPYSLLGEVLRSLGIEPGGALDGILLDLGVSSMQLDQGERGFSFQREGPLDMRMDPTSGETASEFLRNASVREIEDVLRNYGDERHARKVAMAIDRARRQKALETTRDLAALIEEIAPPGPDRIHPATRSFQAIRIAVNRELEHLGQLLGDLDRFLASGARVVVLSYHSIEDRIVKQTLGRRAKEGLLAVITRDVVRPSAEEVARNPRARSARMRVFERR
jgi:16S rRNA (cytosine1402-N4)-methyltransferase